MPKQRKPAAPRRSRTSTTDRPWVGVVMGSKTDWETLRHAAEALAELGVPHEARVVSAHRTPQEMLAYGQEAEARGLEVIVAGAGGAAHLPGVTAAFTTLPVIGVPILGKALDGLDSLLSIVQMPPGVPVATVGINAARNAGLLAAQIIGSGDAALQSRLDAFKERLAAESRAKNKTLAA